MTDPRTDNLIDECKRQEESCLYTSTALFELLKHLRYWKVFFIVAPIIFAALATALPNIFSGTGWIAAICVMLAGIATAVYKALRLDVSLDLIAKAANQYKALQDRFRQARTLLAAGDYDKFNKEFLDRMQQMDAVRAITTPHLKVTLTRRRLKLKAVTTTSRSI
jgi:hypothetical protein